jgi:hypothetical protein
LEYYVLGGRDGLQNAICRHGFMILTQGSALAADQVNAGNPDYLYK